MKVRGFGFPSEDEIFWEISADRDSADGKSLEFKHIFITKEQVRQMAEHLEELVGDDAPAALDKILEEKKRRAAGAIVAWRNGCIGGIN